MSHDGTDVQQSGATLTLAGWTADRYQRYREAAWVADQGLMELIVRESRGAAKDGILVDLGCGMGHVLEAFSPVARECLGVDLDQNMLDSASQPPNVKYVCGDMRQLTEPICDVVIARNVLHYVAPHDVIEVAVRLLRPGGVAVLCQAVPPSRHVRGWHDELHRILSAPPAPSTDDIVACLRMGGFTDIRASFHFHRMNVEEWLASRVGPDSPAYHTAHEHHTQLEDCREYEPDFGNGATVVTVRFAVVSGVRTGQSSATA